jgi:hypothetical protein
MELENLKQITVGKIRAAEAAVWTYFVEFVRTDIGPELGQWLDTTCGGCELSPSLEGNKHCVDIRTGMPWSLHMSDVTILVRPPNSTEIALQYRRGQPHAYTNLEWRSQDWTSRSRPREERTGKYAAIRYMLADSREDEAKVVPAEMDEWFIGNNIESTRIAAAEFAKEKLELEEKAKELRQSAHERLRGITGRRGG